MTSRPKVFPSNFYPSLYAAERKHWWFIYRAKIINLLMSRYIPLGKKSYFLEVGCGTGYCLEQISRNFPDVQLSASEYYSSAFKYARNRVPGCSFMEVDICSMDFSDKYDCIGAFDVIEHIDDHYLALANIYKALKSGGSVILTVPQHQWLWSAADSFSCHFRRYESSNMHNLLDKTGFSITYASSFVFFLLPLMFVQRLLITESNLTPGDSLNMPKFANFVCSLFMKLEIFLLGIGIRFPVGGSLLVIAKKS